MLKRTHHTDKKFTDGITTVTITHPFHPDTGKEFECLGHTPEHARCLDDKGSLRLFPIKSTSLYVPAIGEAFAEGGFVVSVDDLLALKAVLDWLQGRSEM